MSDFIATATALAKGLWWAWLFVSSLAGAFIVYGLLVQHRERRHDELAAAKLRAELDNPHAVVLWLSGDAS